MQFKHFLSYSPTESGSVFALLYLEQRDDIYGWHAEARGQYFSAGFFMIDHFYASRFSGLYRSAEDDIHDPWIVDYPPVKDVIRCPLPELVSHELESMQSAFIDEWLFFMNEPGTETELAAYAARGLPVHAASIKTRRLGRLDKRHSPWTHSPPNVNQDIVTLLRRYWRLSDKMPAP